MDRHMAKRSARQAWLWMVFELEADPSWIPLRPSWPDLSYAGA